MGNRILYIDYLKGLSIIWVVWYHTVHPWFVDFSFRIPLFFLASGIFFKIVDVRTYIQKKTNQLLVPFVFFSLIYYLYLMLQNYFAYGTLSAFDFSCIFGVFEPHYGAVSFKIDPPLWFICALICMQLITWVLVKVLRKRWLIAIGALVVTWLGIKYLYLSETYFMFGRASVYVVYYVFGHLYGKDLLKIVESKSRPRASVPLVIATSVFFLSIVAQKTFLPNNGVLKGISVYTETFGLIVMLIYFFKGIHRFKLAYPFWFYGRNSYIVLGVHEIYQTIFMVFFLHIMGEITIWIGIVQTLLSLLLLWPTILVLNKYVPQLVGKATLIDFSMIKLFQRI